MQGVFKSCNWNWCNAGIGFFRNHRNRGSMTSSAHGIPLNAGQDTNVGHWVFCTQFMDILRHKLNLSLLLRTCFIYNSLTHSYVHEQHARFFSASKAFFGSEKLTLDKKTAKVHIAHHTTKLLPHGKMWSSFYFYWTEYSCIDESCTVLSDKEYIWIAVKVYCTGHLWAVTGTTDIHQPELRLKLSKLEKN